MFAQHNQTAATDQPGPQGQRKQGSNTDPQGQEKQTTASRERCNTILYYSECSTDHGTDEH